jgi:hypothetical protein
MLATSSGKREVSTALGRFAMLTTKRYRSELLTALIMVVTGCNSPSKSSPFAFVDEETPPPPGRPTDFVPPSVVKPESAAKDPSLCGYGTGKRADGTCVSLGLRTSATNQQLHLPAGRVQLGTLLPASTWERARVESIDTWWAQPLRSIPVESFWIDVIEVSRRAYGECVRSGQCTSARCPDESEPSATSINEDESQRLPRTCVTQAQAQAYCEAQGGSLPTEAQWVYAARGATNRIFPWGDSERDEINAALQPVGRRFDASFFGILGLAQSGLEWTLDASDVDADLFDYLEGPFRQPQGPLRRHQESLLRRFVCGNDRTPCKIDKDSKRRFVTKGMRVSQRTPVFAAGSADPSLSGAEATLAFAHSSPLLGFRCVMPSKPEEEVLTIPEQPAENEVVVASADGELLIFLGIAAMVSQPEAQRYCQRLKVPRGEATLTDWNLPAPEELEKFSDQAWIPGSLWLSRRRAGKAQGEVKARAWVEVAAVADSPRQAVCVAQAPRKE